MEIPRETCVGKSRFISFTERYMGIREEICIGKSRKHVYICRKSRFLSLKQVFNSNVQF